jgi:hypothetical protein
MARITLLIAVFTSLVFAQTPPAKGKPGFTSPPAATSVEVAGQKISVDYYSPSMHGRKIMGGLVPFGAVWCTGANYATRITTPADLQMGGLKLPKGEYSIWTIPNEKEWTLIINKETGQFHLNYKQQLDFGRTPMKVKTIDSPVEAFRVDLRDNGGNKGTLALVWETTEAYIPFTVLQ